MTLGIGGWGSRRKPMALVRAMLRSDLTDLTVVSYGGPDVGMLARPAGPQAGGRPSSRSTRSPSSRTSAARESGAIELTEVDEGMFMWGLRAAANRLPFLPVRAGSART
jgi:glutaconate CoA-transferase subunit A